MVAADDPQAATLNEIRQSISRLRFKPAASAMGGNDQTCVRRLPVSHVDVGAGFEMIVC
jgi:hypothetical protein